VSVKRTSEPAAGFTVDAAKEAEGAARAAADARIESTEIARLRMGKAPKIFIRGQHKSRGADKIPALNRS
jgi:hypothetical protein